MKPNVSAQTLTARCAAVALLTLGSACAATLPAPTEALVCAGWTPPPIQPQDIEVVSDPLAVWLAQTVAFGEAQCGW